METVNATIGPKVNKDNLAFEMRVQPKGLRNIKPSMVRWELFRFQFSNILLQNVVFHLFQVTRDKILIPFYENIVTEVFNVSFY